MRGGVTLLFPSARLCFKALPIFRNIRIPNWASFRSFTTVSAVASAFKPEEARPPPAIPLPGTPVSKFKIALCQLSRMLAGRSRRPPGRGPSSSSCPKYGIVPLQMIAFQCMRRILKLVAMQLHHIQCCLQQLVVCRSLVGCSIPERSGEHLYDTYCVFGTDGKLKGKH